MTRDGITQGLAIGAGLLLVAGAFFFLFRQSRAAGGVEGVIVAKQFESAPETQITVGRGGVHRRERPGVYLLQVKAEGAGGKVYALTVDPKIYAEHGVGDRFYFVPPPREEFTALRPEASKAQTAHSPAAR